MVYLSGFSSGRSSQSTVSASHQALRMFSYLGRPSMRSIQTMVLITYFLMNDNHASDAWAFAGVLIRQAYALVNVILISRLYLPSNIEYF